MNFSFCINTYSGHGKDCGVFIPQIISSIEEQNIPNYEILICGDYQIERKNVRCIPFDESQRSGWITRKKNILTKEAQYNNLCFLHDYIYLLPNWYKGWLHFGSEWDAGLNVILNQDNTRFRDLIAFDDLENPGPKHFQHKNFPEDKSITTAPYLPDYKYKKFNKTYISGSYFVIKKYLMEQEPFDEKLTHGLPEDIEFSMRIRNKYHLIFNTYCGVKLTKYKDSVWKSLYPYHMTYDYITKDFIT